MPETVSLFLYKEGRNQKYEGNILGNVVSWKDFHYLVVHSYFTTIVSYVDFRCIIWPYKCLLFSVLSKIVPSDISIRRTPVWNAIKHQTSILAHKSLTLIGMRQGGFTSLVILGLDFVSWIFIKNFQTFLEVKIQINQDNLTPCQAYWVL